MIYNYKCQVMTNKNKRKRVIKMEKIIKIEEIEFSVRIDFIDNRNYAIIQIKNEYIEEMEMTWHYLEESLMDRILEDKEEILKEYQANKFNKKYQWLY